MIYRFVCPYFETVWVGKEGKGTWNTDIVIYIDTTVVMSITGFGLDKDSDKTIVTSNDNALLLF